MTNQLILIKFQQRLDKLSSSDFGNVEDWMYIEVFNKAHIQWVRRQLEGINQEKTGAEGSTRRIDDMQYLLLTLPMTMADQGLYWNTKLPDDYLQFNRVSCMAKDDCCPERMMTVFERTEADRDINLQDNGKQPDFDWATTFCTIAGNNLNIYTNDTFDITSATLTYYKTPVNIQINSVANPVTGTLSTSDVLCEAPDNIIEILIDEGVSILSADIEDYNRSQSSAMSVERNT